MRIKEKSPGGGIHLGEASAANEKETDVTDEDANYDEVILKWLLVTRITWCGGLLLERVWGGY